MHTYYTTWIQTFGTISTGSYLQLRREAFAQTGSGAKWERVAAEPEKLFAFPGHFRDSGQANRDPRPARSSEEAIEDLEAISRTSSEWREWEDASDEAPARRKTPLSTKI